MSDFHLNTIHLDSVDSTNTYTKALLKSGEPLAPYTVVYTKEQTAGRGRLGRTWHSREGDSLCMSLAVPHDGKPGITLLSALGVHSALSSLCEKELSIKWPNDIIAGNKKLSGILTEAVGTWAVIGIGINLNNTDFPHDISHKSTSLKLLCGKSFEPEDIAKSVAQSVFETLDKHHGELNSDAIKAYSPLCANIGREVTAGEKKGIATAIDTDGSLIALTENGVEKISFGEVTVSGIY